jgi:amino acid adenylation domain-containing protein/thioester reductase-like protein
MNDFSQRIAALSPEKQALLKLKLQRHHIQPSQPLSIPSRKRSNSSENNAESSLHFPVSFAQQRMWFQDQLGINSAVSNNVSVALRITGSLSVSALEQSIKAILHRHEILRTTLQTINGELVQVITEAGAWTLSILDLSSQAESDREQEAQRLATDQACQPFDLATDLLLRATLLKRDAEAYDLLLTLHHSAVDAWSIGIFFRELSTLYGAFASGKPSPLNELPIQYADFAVWQRQYFQGDVLNQELAYWTQKLQNATDRLQLPSDRPRPAVQSFVGKTLSFSLSKTLTDSLKQLSQHAEATLFMTLLAALQTLLFRYTGQEDILVGSPIANRHQPEVETLIGCFINTLVLRTDLSGNPSFRALLDRVRETVLGALAHQTLPFEKLVDELRLNRNVAYAPLFQVMLVLQNAFSIQNIELPGLTIDHSRIDNQTAQFDLTIHLVEADTGLIGKLEYSTDLFDESTMLRFLEHLQTLLAGIIANPDQLLSELPLLTPAEHHQLLTWNFTDVPDFPTDCIHHRFAAQVEKTPAAIAVICGDQQISYRELHHRANQLAHHLQTLGVGPDCLVGICVERSLPLIVGLMGILKAGAAYVPLDPGYPQHRLEWMVSDAQVSLLLTQQSLTAKLSPVSVPVICLDTDWTKIAQECHETPVSPVQAEHLAYVIYTSGSTGQPKGVMIQHQSLVNYTEFAQREYAISTRDRILQLASISFDTAAEEIFPCLTQGATLVLRTDSMFSSMATFLQTCQAWQLTLLDLPTAFWHQLVTELSRLNLTLPDSVRLVIIGGEAALPDRLALWQQRVAPSVRLVNTYGPTEATIVATTADLSELPTPVLAGQALPIGKAVSHTSTYILDPNLHLTPIGVPGELYIGGVGLARGYLHRPDLTAQSFIPNPFSPVPGARLYKTGDRARYRPDGTLEFLGRLDNQVKVRGFRIELGEIEALLTQHPHVQDNVVIAHQEQTGDTRLIAYIVPKSSHTPTPRQLRQFLEKRLPKYMVPAVFRILEALPLNANGKVDRQALPVPNDKRSERVAEPLVPPQTSTEMSVAKVFAEVLQVESVGIDDDFFELGGHSLLATKLIAQLTEVTQVGLTIVDLFESPTVAELAKRIETKPTLDIQQSSISTGTPVVNLADEVSLDPTIVSPGAGNSQRVLAPTQILLTGATGFLGAFLLAELLRQTPATVYCLVRDQSSKAGIQKIQANLNTYLLWEETFRDRIIPLVGDLSQPLLGLTQNSFQAIATQVEVIYHSGACVNLSYPYAALKAINVLGTQEILRLASHITLKPVHFVSTLSVVHSLDYADREIVTEADGLDRWQGLYNGYSQSKWVAEHLMKIAQNRGIPTCIYRPGVITGNSQTGACNPQDFLNTLLRGFIQLKRAPELDALWDFAPVDYVSQAIVHLSQQKDAIGNVFHLLNPQPIHLSHLVDLIHAFGYPIQRIPYDQWRADLINFVRHSQDGFLESLSSLFPEQLSEKQLQLLRLRFDCQNTTQRLANTSITCPPVDNQLLKTYFSYLMRNGFLLA